MAGAPNMLVTEGVLYYELEIKEKLQNAYASFGFATREFQVEDHDIDLGVGDDDPPDSSWGMALLPTSKCWSGRCCVR